MKDTLKHLKKSKQKIKKRLNEIESELSLFNKNPLVGLERERKTDEGLDGLRLLSKLVTLIDEIESHIEEYK